MFWTSYRTCYSADFSLITRDYWHEDITKCVTAFVPDNLAISELLSIEQVNLTVVSRCLSTSALVLLKKERKQSFRSLKSLSLSRDQTAANRIAGGPIVVTGKKTEVVFIIYHLFNRDRLDDFHRGDPVNEGVAAGAHKVNGVADIQID